MLAITSMLSSHTVCISKISFSQSMWRLTIISCGPDELQNLVIKDVFFPKVNDSLSTSSAVVIDRKRAAIKDVFLTITVKVDIVITRWPLIESEDASPFCLGGECGIDATRSKVNVGRDVRQRIRSYDVF
jgi:hypothetical protein